MSRATDAMSAASTPLRFALAADHNVIPGVHVTVASLLQSLSQSDNTEVTLFYTNWSDQEIASLSRTIAMNSQHCVLRTYPLDLRPLVSLRPVRGSVMNFAWFLIPEFFADRVILLDTDLVITIDLSPLAALPLNDEHLCAAVSWQKLISSPNWPIFRSFGMSGDQPAFIGGLYVIAADKWNANAISAKCLDLRERLQHRLCGGIDPILNIVLYGRYRTLDRKYNTPIWPSQGRLSEDTLREPRVWHFAARPKPWEFLGYWVHHNSSLFRKFLKHTDIFPHARSYSLNVSRALSSLLRFHRAYLRRLLQSVRGCRRS